MNIRPPLVLVTVLALFAATAEARRDRHFRGPTGTYNGVIAAIAANTLRVNVGEEKEKIVIFSTDAKTTITDDGKSKSLNDLKAGQHVKVKAKNGWARSIEVRPAGDKVDRDSKDGK